MLRAEYEAREQGITQTDIGRACGINRVTINRIMRGWEIPKDTHKERIATALGWDGDPAELFQEIEVK